MKTKEKFEEEGFYLRPSECSELNVVIAQLEQIVKDKKINTNLLSTITNVSSEVSAMRDKISWRLINLAKQGHKID